MKICLPLAVLSLAFLSPLAAADPVDVSVDKADELLASDEDVIVLDVRTAEEYAEGHLEGAVNADYTGDDFEAQVAKLDPEKPYIVHCAAGGRSGKSMKIFKKLKFTKIYHLEDGYNGWIDAEKPVVK